MKYNFVYLVLEIELIVKLFGWLWLTIKTLLIWWYRKFCWCLDRKLPMAQKPMYEFRPFELTRVDYKNYSRISGLGSGIIWSPKPRSGHRIALNDTDLFCFGGFNPHIASPYLFKEMWKFNLLTQRWSTVFTAESENMPEELVSNAVAIKDDIMLVFGGTAYEFGVKRSNKCYLFYPYASPKNIKLLETSGDKPEPQYGQALIVRDKYLYVCGGTTGHEYTCDIYRLDLVSRIWECVYICNELFRDEDPKGRYRHEIAHDDNFFYIFGGGTREHTFDLENVPTFDINNNKWIYIKTKADPNCEVPGYPEPRKFHSCVQQNTPDGIEVFIAGGFKADTILLRDIWKLNLRTYQWTRMGQTKLPYELYFHDAATNDSGLMYIFGGTMQSNTRTNDLHKMWLKIPKLSEMCWDAMLHYCPLLPKMEKSKLMEIGVPQKFAERAVRSQTNQNVFL